MYTIGVDFGTLSGRALLVDAQTGEEAANSVFAYPLGVIDKRLPGSDKPLPHEWALQHPQDYLDVLANTIPAVLRESGVTPDQVAAIAVDFTASSPMPVTSDGTPLCTITATDLAQPDPSMRARSTTAPCSPRLMAAAG